MGLTMNEYAVLDMVRSRGTVKNKGVSELSPKEYGSDLALTSATVSSIRNRLLNGGFILNAKEKGMVSLSDKSIAFFSGGVAQDKSTERDAEQLSAVKAKFRLDYIDYSRDLLNDGNKAALNSLYMELTVLSDGLYGFERNPKWRKLMEKKAKGDVSRPSNKLMVMEYFMTKGLSRDDANVEAGKFWNFYESKGWLVGKTPMQKWRSAANNFISDYSNSKENGENTINWESL